MFGADLFLIGLLLFFFLFIFKTFLPLKKNSSSSDKLCSKSGSECLGGGGEEQTKIFSAVVSLILSGPCSLRTES